MIVLDTTVLVYVVGDEHPLRQPCRTLLDAIGDGSLSATTTVEVIQEFAHVRARRRTRADAASLAQGYCDLLSPLLRPGEADLSDGLDLFLGTPDLGAFDAVLAATVMNTSDAEAIVSADAAFGAVSGLVHVDPADSAQLDALLGA